MDIIAPTDKILSAYACDKVFAVNIPVQDTSNDPNTPFTTTAEVVMVQPAFVPIDTIQPQWYILINGHRIEFVDTPTVVPYAIQCYPDAPRPANFRELMANDLAACLSYLYPEGTIEIIDNSNIFTYKVNITIQACDESARLNISGGFEPNDTPLTSILLTSQTESTQTDTNNANVVWTVLSTDECDFNGTCASVSKFKHQANKIACGCVFPNELTASIKPQKIIQSLLRSDFPIITDTITSKLLSYKAAMTRAFKVRAEVSGNNEWTNNQSNRTIVTDVYTAVNSRLTPNYVQNANTDGLELHTNELVTNQFGSTIQMPSYPLNLAPFDRVYCANDIVLAQWLVLLADAQIQLNVLVDGTLITDIVTTEQLSICDGLAYYKVIEANIGIVQLTNLLNFNGIQPSSVSSVSAYLTIYDGLGGVVYSTTPYNYSVNKTDCTCKEGLKFIYLSSLGSWETATAKPYKDTVNTFDYTTFDKCSCFTGSPPNLWQTTTVKQNSKLTQSFRAKYCIENISDTNLLSEFDVYNELINAKAVYLYRRIEIDLTRPTIDSNYLFYPVLITEAEGASKAKGFVNFNFQLYTLQALNQ